MFYIEDFPRRARERVLSRFRLTLQCFDAGDYARQAGRALLANKAGRRRAVAGLRRHRLCITLWHN